MICVSLVILDRRLMMLILWDRICVIANRILVMLVILLILDWVVIILIIVGCGFFDSETDVGDLCDFMHVGMAFNAFGNLGYDFCDCESAFCDFAGFVEFG